MCLWLLKKGVGSGSRFGAGSSLFMKGTTPGIRIRTKMSRITNTGLWCICNCECEVSIRLIWSVCITILSNQRLLENRLSRWYSWNFLHLPMKPICTAEIRETKKSKILKMFKYKSYITLHYKEFINENKINSQSIMTIFHFIIFLNTITTAAFPWWPPFFCSTPLQTLQIHSIRHPSTWKTEITAVYLIDKPLQYSCFPPVEIEPFTFYSNTTF
jgi:hypothetical protein